jgi:ATP-dependent exoDNAse (exonuclease V) beta subunit
MPASGLTPSGILRSLKEHLSAYFGDTKNKPWTWLDGAKSEVRFSHVTKSDEEEVTLKGFIGLVRFQNGKPIQIIDYRTGRIPENGSDEKRAYAEQLRRYRQALACQYGLELERLMAANYHIPE